ncbi:MULTISPECIES: hypothetical protein [Pseudomonas]|jgi:hypothetical protein|uniref:Lipoprotein n=1 Tax=Pseudomonas putida S12 TaxID=1215087 RepID=A0AA34WTB0_PSEPU|nr:MULTISPECIES: hypothetical protein [Pseudomonas]HBK48553.1 hypothetical protein [Pseudomonas sp.]ADR60138.1 Hypothetical protein, conserved [Pseudomonas putida BIRD-1]AJA15939.1 hypothetical protein RPPX_22275 [Pseudomonas putida S12]MDW2777743.1 hypothetical protein [Pseudomonas sp. BEA3.1]RIZ40768.1 hypothetical protein CIK02_14270 [Pseudomonas putida]
MRVPALMMMVASLASGQAWAEACNVLTRSSSDAVTPVERHTCYSYSNMPAEVINWSCSNESKDMLNSEKSKVARCADGSVGSCIAPLTTEALANPKAIGGKKPALPKDARVITYYYDTPSLGQARSDCERNNGVWQTH